MKINFQKLKRVLPSLITVCVIVAMCALPAFAVAEPVSIWDYADVQVDGTTKLVTIRFPEEWVEITIPRGNGTIFFQQTGNGSTVDFTDSGFTDFANVYFNPLRSYFKTDAERPYDGLYLDLSVLPNGSQLTFAVSAKVTEFENINTYVRDGYFVYGSVDVDAQTIGDFVTYKAVVEETEQDVYSIEYNYTINGLVKNFVPQIRMIFLGLPAVTGNIYFNLDDFVITTTVDALRDLQNTVEENNRILDEIKEQMNITNQNWQDFLDGKAEWQDIVDSSTDKVEDAVGDMNDVSDALATVPKPEIDIDSLVPDELAGQEYLNYINVIQQIWSNPLISTVTYIMGCMLVLSYLLFGERG